MKDMPHRLIAEAIFRHHLRHAFHHHADLRIRLIGL